MKTKKNLNDEKWVNSALGKEQSHRYGNKFYNEERNKAIQKHDSIEAHEKAKRLAKLKLMGMI